MAQKKSAPSGSNGKERNGFVLKERQKKKKESMEVLAKGTANRKGGRVANKGAKE